MQVIKIGGNEIDDPAFVAQMGDAVAALTAPPILVHGGGKAIKALQEQLGVEPQYIDGLRVTDKESLEIVQMVLAGRINKNLVASLSMAGVDAFGMSGVDRATLKVEKLQHPNGDLGQVGRIVEVRREVFQHFLDAGVTPVLSPICYGPDGGIFNVNADHVAEAVAAAMQADVLVFVSNVPGVLKDEKVLPQLAATDIKTLIDKKVIVGGMLPKVNAALSAVAAGVNAVRITNLAGLKQGTGTTIIRTAQKLATLEITAESTETFPIETENAAPKKEQ